MLVGVEACDVGLTVLNCIRGDLGDDPADLPRVPSHELVGTATALGPGVDEALSGTRLMAYFYPGCATCRRCQAVQESLCERLGGYVGVNRDGAYASHRPPVAERRRRARGRRRGGRHRDPRRDRDASARRRRAGIGRGERVAVLAAGGSVGVHMVQIAPLYGADVAGLKVSPAKLHFLSPELGVAAIDSADFDRVALPPDWADAADVIVDLLGTPASLPWSLRTLAPNGRLVVLTTFRGIGVEISPRDMVLKQHSVVASRYAGRADRALAARLVAEGRVRPVIGRTAGAGEVDELHDALRRGELLGRGALTWQTTRASELRPMIIDVHHHALAQRPPDLFARDPVFRVEVDGRRWHGGNDVDVTIADEFAETGAKLAQLDRLGLDAPIVLGIPPRFYYEVERATGRPCAPR